MKTNKAGDIVSKGIATCTKCGRAYGNDTYEKCPFCAERARRAAAQAYIDALCAKAIARYHAQTA